MDNNASATASVVEVRAEDVVGQLHRITRALVDCRLDVQSAKVSTFGSAVVDAFYVHGPDGGKLTDLQLIADVEAAIRRRIDVGRSRAGGRLRCHPGRRRSDGASTTVHRHWHRKHPLGW